MKENEYKGDEKVVCKTRGKLSLPHEKIEEVACFVTEGHVVIEAKQPIKIPVLRIRECETTIELPPEFSTSRARSLFSGTATLTFLDDLNEKQKLSLEMAAGDVGHFEYAIKLVKEYPGGIPPLTDIDKFFESLKDIGVQAEIIDGITVKLIGRNIDEIQLRYGTRFKESTWGPGEELETYLAGLTYIVKLETLQEIRDLIAETDTYERSRALGIKWIGGELAFHLNEDTELASLLTEAGERNIHIKAKQRPQRVEMLGGFEDIPKTKVESLLVYERIAKHVREVASATVRTPGVSRGERRVVRGSIRRRVIDYTLGGAVGGFVVGIIWVAVNARNKDLSTFDFIIAAILIVGFALMAGLWKLL